MSENPDSTPQFVASETPAPELGPPPEPPEQEQPKKEQNGEIFWGWHDVVLFVMITVVAMVVAMLAGMGIRSLFHLSEARMNMVLVAAQFAAYGVSFTGLKLMFRAEYDEPLMASLHWLPARIEPGRLVLMGMMLALGIAMISAFMKVPQVDTPMNRLLADRPTAILIAIVGVTIAPLAEELAFRGLLQPLMVRSIGVTPGILLTSVAFGAMHLEQYGAWQSVVLITLAGCGFGAVRQWTGSTRASAIMHAGYNAALVILYFFTQKGSGH